MGALFDLPTSRSSKKADKLVVAKASTSKSALTISTKSGLLGQIAEINARVESKIGKYKDEYTYFMAKDEEAFKEYIYNTIYTGYCAMDTETTGLDPLQDKIVGMSLYSKGQKGLYLPINHKSYITNEIVDGQLDKRIIAEQLQRLVNANVKFKEFNAKFDTRVVNHNLGVYVPCWFDGYLAGKLLNENEPSSGLKALHSKYVLDGKEDEFSFGKLFNNVPFDLIPIKTAYIYAARDAVDTDELVDWQLPYLTKTNPLCIEYGLEKVADVFWNIEMPCMPVLAKMEDTGVAFDTELADKLSIKYHDKKDKILDRFYMELAKYDELINKFKLSNPSAASKLSEPISISSPSQLAILFYDILKVDTVDMKSPRSTGSEVLSKIDNPLCKIILDYRETDKLLGTYIDKLPKCINKDDGRVHCSFNQYGAKTGRMSSDSPNLQNIPSKNHDIRKMFIATPGYVMMSSDYSQQEPKAMTVMCQDPTMIDAYNHGKDLYAQIAALSFNTTYEECLEHFPKDSKIKKVGDKWYYASDDDYEKLADGETDTYADGKARRTSAKSILLGILYGRGINSVAEQLHTTKEKAQEIQDRVFKGFPAIKQFEDDTKYMAENYGYVVTYWGRKRRLPEMQLPEFEFEWIDGKAPSTFDALDFNTEQSLAEVPYDRVRYYTNKMRRAWGTQKNAVVEEAKGEGIKIINNGGKIADATRQCVNSRIQGSAADLTKLAAIELDKCERLKELGFRLLVPIHDEYLAECPKENAKECAKLFSECMSKAAKDWCIPINTDVSITTKWYGDEVSVDEL